MGRKVKPAATLTNEAIKSYFADNFSMANFIIEVAKNNQASGKEFTLNSLMTEVLKIVERRHIESQELETEPQETTDHEHIG